ncbi:MAG: hypothetical protein K8E66_03500, partial [Phycisphaerales bacterium]|nr:hypothetical protein [Phycisphaerales bacterium]
MINREQIRCVARLSAGVVVLACVFVATADVNTYSGAGASYQTARDEFLADFMSLAGETVPLEDFDGLNPADPVG